MQTVKRFECNGKSAIVRFDVDWQEYVVQFYSNGVHMDNCDYYADYRDDAFDTAQYAIQIYSNGVHMDASDYHTEYRDDAFDTAQYAIEQERNYFNSIAIGT